MGKIMKAIKFLAAHDSLTPEVAESMLRARDWEESQHPRDKDGKFTAGGGGGGSGEESSASGAKGSKSRSFKGLGGKANSVENLRNAYEHSKVTITTPEGDVTFEKGGFDPWSSWHNTEDYMEYYSPEKMQEKLKGSNAKIVLPNEGTDFEGAYTAKEGDRIKSGDMDFTIGKKDDFGGWTSYEGKFGKIETGKKYKDTELAEKFGATGWNDPNGTEMELRSVHCYPGGKMEMNFRSSGTFPEKMAIVAKSAEAFAKTVSNPKSKPVEPYEPPISVESVKQKDFDIIPKGKKKDFKCRVYQIMNMDKELKDKPVGTKVRIESPKKDNPLCAMKTAKNEWTFGEFDSATGQWMTSNYKDIYSLASRVKSGDVVAIQEPGANEAHSLHVSKNPPPRGSFWI